MMAKVVDSSRVQVTFPMAAKVATGVLITLLLALILGIASTWVGDRERMRHIETMIAVHEVEIQALKEE